MTELAMRKRRRAIIAGAGADKAKRIYVFKDGAYQDWLATRQFQIGGYTTDIAGPGTPSNPIRSINIEDGILVLHFESPANRTNHVCFGIHVGDILPGSIKKIGGVMSCTTYQQSSDTQWIECGASETFISTTTGLAAALGTYELFQITSEAPAGIEFELQNPDMQYIVFYMMRHNHYVREIRITDLWVEV